VIGVILKDGQLPIVEEFFELFKTPWEICTRGRTYDVVVATHDEGSLPQARLVIIFGSRNMGNDTQLGIEAGTRRQGGAVSYEKASLPIYGELLTFVPETGQVVCVTTSDGIAGLSIRRPGSTLIRIGYDLFEEVRSLLSAGQPVEHAAVPTLDLHVDMLRNWIVGADIPVVEIPPVPAGHDFSVCLTHDIDFVGIRDHKLDHSMWGFLYRATFGSARNFLRGRLTLARLLKTWRAALSLPFVFLGWAKDFWEPFSWYLAAEAQLPATYYMIPVKRRAGERVPGKGARRRATAYDVTDVREWTARLIDTGCEVGVHGIDAWHDPVKGREEMGRVAGVTGGSALGIRMHWLLQNAETPAVLEKAGYSYDSTAGYNETIGYRNGTSQVFRPLGAHMLLELPMHIQDGALFYPQRLDLAEPEAAIRCRELIDRNAKLGGVLTVLWHDRSHGPERFWGDFYVGLIATLKSTGAWFATATQVVGWFRRRRAVRFRQVDAAGGAGIIIESDGEEICPALRLRVHRPSPASNGESLGSTTTDITWDGRAPLVLDSAFRRVADGAARPRVQAAAI
jgi:hypothetical protein